MCKIDKEILRESDIIVRTEDGLMFFDVKLSKELDRQLEREIRSTTGSIVL